MSTPHQRLRAARNARHFTQTDVANLIGLSLRSYMDIENGATRLTLARLDDLAEALGVPASWIAYGVDGEAARADHMLDLQTLDMDLSELVQAMTSGNGAGEKLMDLAGDLRGMIERLNRASETPKPVAA